MKHLKTFRVFESSLYKEYVPASEIKEGMQCHVLYDGKYMIWEIRDIFKNLQDLKNYFIDGDDYQQREKFQIICNNPNKYENRVFVCLIYKEKNEDNDISMQLAVYGEDDLNFSDDKEIYVSKQLSDLNKTGIFENSEDDYHVNIPHKKIAYYDIDKDQFEYMLKLKSYNIKPSVSYFLNSKDYLIMVKNGKAIGYLDAKALAQKMKKISSEYKNINSYKKDMFILSSAKLNKLNDKTGLFN